MKFFINIFLLTSVLVSANGEEKCEPDDIKLLNDENKIHEYIQIDDWSREIAINSSLLWNLQRNNMDKLFKITCLKSVKFQIVSGMLYTVNATISETVCEKNIITNLSRKESQESCDLKSDGVVLNCAFKYWTQIWIDNYSLVDADCIRK